MRIEIFVRRLGSAYASPRHISHGSWGNTGCKIPCALGAACPAALLGAPLTLRALEDFASSRPPAGYF